MYRTSKCDWLRLHEVQTCGEGTSLGKNRLGNLHSKWNHPVREVSANNPRKGVSDLLALITHDEVLVLPTQGHETVMGTCCGPGKQWSILRCTWPLTSALSTSSNESGLIGHQLPIFLFIYITSLPHFVCPPLHSAAQWSSQICRKQNRHPDLKLSVKYRYQPKQKPSRSHWPGAESQDLTTKITCPSLPAVNLA